MSVEVFLQNAPWLGLMMLGFLGSALFSGIETGCYAVSRIKLHLLSQHGDPAARRLERWLEKPQSLLSTLLIGNNVCNYMGTFGLAVLLNNAGFSDLAQVFLNILIVTPLLLILGETLPKDLFAGYSDKLLYPLTPFIGVTKRLLTWVGLVPLVTLFGAGVLRLLGGGSGGALAHPRRRVQALMREGVGQVVTHEQSDLLERVFLAERRLVGDETVPWSAVQTVSIGATAAELFALAQRSSRSRLPVVDPDGRVVGVLDLFEMLLFTPEECPALAELLNPAAYISPYTGLRTAWAAFQANGWGLAIVGDPEKPVGVVTMKDLVEPITGELIRW